MEADDDVDEGEEVEDEPAELVPLEFMRSDELVPDELAAAAAAARRPFAASICEWKLLALELTEEEDGEAIEGEDAGEW